MREISLARGLGLRARLVCVAGGGRTPWCMGGRLGVVLQARSLGCWVWG